MQAETPATGITKTWDHGDSKFYRVECNCGNEDDAITFNVEWDDEVNEVLVHTWTIQKTPWWDDKLKKRYDIENEFVEWLHWTWVDFWNALFRRVQLTWQIWFYGYVKYEAWTIMNKQQAINYAEALKQAVEQVEVNAKSRKSLQEDRDRLLARVRTLEKENEKLRWSLEQQD